MALINIIIQITPVIIGFSLIRYSWKKITYSEESKDNILNSSQLLVKAVVNHGKEIVQDVKPAINNYIEKHSTDEIIVSNSMDKEEHMKCEDINEDEIYDNVMLEIEEDKKIRSTWAKALSLSDGDENKANSLYIKLRVDFLIQEKKNIIENEKKKIEEQELFLKQEKATANTLPQPWASCYAWRGFPPVWFRGIWAGITAKPEGITSLMKTMPTSGWKRGRKNSADGCVMIQRLSQKPLYKTRATALWRFIWI